MPIRFGPDATLFGILSVPGRLVPRCARCAAWSIPARIRAGAMRGSPWTLRAAWRRMAWRSLRMDASGMGDTAPRTGEVGRPYAEAMTRDVLHAAEELALANAATCRGAWRMFRRLSCTAGSLHRDRASDGLILVNLQRFVWRRGDPSDIVRRSD